MRCPVDYISIVRGFETEGFNKHYGVDFGWYSQGHENQNIYSAYEGVVIYKKYQVTGGNVVHILHNFGEGGYYVTEYGHLKDVKVKVGDKVTRTTVIGHMGRTGICTGNHLHFGVYRGAQINYNDKSKWLDPLRFLNVYNGQVINDKSKSKMWHVREVAGVKDEPLLVHNRANYLPSSVCGELYNGDIVEYYGVYNGMAVIDTIVGRWCSNKYIK